VFGQYVLPIEEYFDEHKADYYYYLEKNTRHLDGFTTFFVKGLIWSLERLLADIKNLGQDSGASASTSALLPRRQEILQIINDHPECSLDFISRRFPTIPVRTIAYDVNWLVKHNHVIKHGETRGVVYSAKTTTT
jgi:hypothetical protein